MNAKRTYFGLIGLNVAVVLVLLGGAYGVRSLLAGQSRTLVSQRQQIQTLDAESSALIRAKQDVANYKDLSAIASSIVPQDKDQAQTVREIVNLAAANNIKLATISFPSSSLGQPSATSTTTTTTPATAPVASAAALALSQLAPVVGIPGVYSLEIVVQSDANSPVPYARFVSFLQALEHNRRTALVSNLTLTPDSKDSKNVTFSLTLNEYIKP